MEQKKHRHIGKTEAFFQEHNHRYTDQRLIYRGVNIRFLYPSAFPGRYTQELQDALDTNASFFGESALPPYLSVTFVESTDDFRYFTQKKVRGDYLRGYASGTRITALLPALYETESDFKPGKYIDPIKAKEDMFHNNLAHEIAHCASGWILQEKYGQFPKWAREAVAMSLEDRKVAKVVPSTNDGIKEFILSRYHGFPTDDQLKSDRLDGKPLIYGFAKMFFRFLRKHTLLNQRDFTVDILNKFKKYDADFPSFLSEYYHKPLEELYKEFLLALPEY